MVVNITASTLVLAAAVALLAEPAFAEGSPCSTDINCSGAVDVSDLLTVIEHWGELGGPGDVNNSGSVDVGDLLAVIQAWGPCVFSYVSYPDAEAHQIGLEMLGANGPLSLSQEKYDRIVRDLNIIRTTYPALAS